MIDQFPLRPDGIWYDALVDTYGDTVPSIARMCIRRGLQTHVGDMFARLCDLDLLRHVDICGIETRTATYVIIDTVERPGAYEDERIALDFALESAKEALSRACEHCGKSGAIIMKMGMEALLADSAAVLGDRFLCIECADNFQGGDVA